MPNIDIATPVSSAPTDRLALGVGWVRPGVGSALTDAIRVRDLPVIQFLSLLIGGVYVLTNLIADVATVLVTPRLRTTLK